jgi:hypothetical protein
MFITKKGLSLFCGKLVLLFLIPLSGYAGVPMFMSYQGQLTGSDGEPVNNPALEIEFKIYTVEKDGTVLWSEVHPDVAVSNGLFSVVLGSVQPVVNPLDLDFDKQYFLGIQVAGDSEMAPRHRLTSAPYAFSSDNADFAANADTLDGKDSNGFANAVHAHSGAAITSGTVAEERIDSAIARVSEIGPMVLAADGSGSTLDADFLDGMDSSEFANSIHVHSGAAITSGTVAAARIDSTIARDSEVGPIVLSLDGPGSTLNADFLDGMDSSAFAADSHVHSGNEITSGTVSEARIASQIARDSEVMTIVLNGDGSGSGVDADTLDGWQASEFARISGGAIVGASDTSVLTVTNTGTAMWSSAIAGYSSSAVNYTDGVLGQTTSGGAGVRGKGPAKGVAGESTDYAGRGVDGVCTGTAGSGLYGTATASTGLAKGVSGISYSINGIGVNGYALSGSGNTWGVYGQAASSSGVGVKGEATSLSGFTIGVEGQVNSPDGVAVSAYNQGDGMGVNGLSVGTGTKAIGVKGLAQATTGVNKGVMGESRSTEGVGVDGYAMALTGSTKGVYGTANSPDGVGVAGLAVSTSGTNYGVRGISQSEDGCGVYGMANNPSGETFGVYGKSTSDKGTGLHGYASSTGTMITYGVYGKSSSERGRGVYGEAAKTAMWKTTAATSPPQAIPHAGFMEGHPVLLPGPTGVDTSWRKVPKGAGFLRKRPEATVRAFVQSRREGTVRRSTEMPIIRMPMQ